MTLIESAISQNILHPILEIFFKAEIRFLKQGQLPVDASGNALQETEFKSTWTTPNKLVRDFHDTIACQLWSTISPDLGCVFWIRDNGAWNQDDKNFTHFTYAVDTRGYETGASSWTAEEFKKIHDSVFAKTDEQPKPRVLTPEEIVISLIEARGIHINHLEKGQRAPNSIEELHFHFRWDTAAELIAQVNSTLDSYLQINAAKCIHIRVLETYETVTGEYKPPITRAILAFEF